METTRVNRWRIMGRWAAMFMLALGGFGFAAATDVMAGTLSGFVTRPNSNGLANVTISVTGLAAQTTGTAGGFSFSLANSGTYTVTPQLAGHRFTPSSITFTVAGGVGFDARFNATREIRGDFDNAFAPSSDVAVWRPSDGKWYLHGGATTQFGASTDIPAPADFNGDGKTDNVVFRPSTGEWHLLINGAYSGLQWGTAGDIPVARDYTGDGKADFAVYRPSDGTWYILNSVTFAASVYNLGSSTVGDKPAPGYYDDDGIADIAVFRPAIGTWDIRYSSNGSNATIYSTATGSDRPVQADYDGDLKTDAAFYRPSDGSWHILKSGNNNTETIRQWGNSSDKAVPADYDGDGKSDIAVFRPGTGTWFILQSSVTPYSQYEPSYIAYGFSSDVPLAAGYLAPQ